MDGLLSIIKSIRAQCPVVKLGDLKKACDALIGTSLLSGHLLVGTVDTQRPWSNLLSLTNQLFGL